MQTHFLCLHLKCDTDEMLVGKVLETVIARNVIFIGMSLNVCVFSYTIHI